VPLSAPRCVPAAYETKTSRRATQLNAGNFSVSEMRTIMAEHFGALALPVGEFLALEHGTEFVGYRRITVGGLWMRRSVCGLELWNLPWLGQFGA
jgi:hypothetical protein